MVLCGIQGGLGIARYQNSKYSSGFIYGPEKTEVMNIVSDALFAIRPYRVFSLDACLSDHRRVLCQGSLPICLRYIYIIRLPSAVQQ